MALKPRVELFCQLYSKDLNGTKACIDAGYAAASAAGQAVRLLRNAKVQSRLAELQASVFERIQLDTDDALRLLAAAAYTDRREFSKLKHVCCRWCHGAEHKYQRSKIEMEKAREAYEVEYQEWKMSLEPDRPPMFAPFDEKGGIGFDPRKKPHPECPACFGKGTIDVTFKDSDDLSPAAAMIFKGYKFTAHGIEVMVEERLPAVNMIAKHLGLLLASKSGDENEKAYVSVSPDDIGTEEEEPDGSEPAVPADRGAPVDVEEQGLRGAARGAVRDGQDESVHGEDPRSVPSLSWRTGSGPSAS